MSAPSESVGGVAARGGAATLIGQAGKILIQLLSLIILSRLLPPSDFGLLAMATVFMGLGELLRDFGLAAAAMQAREISRDQKTNLFWCNAGIGLLLVATAACVAHPVASVYGEPRVEQVLIALSPVLMLNALQTQFQAELGRNLRFGRLVVTDLVAQAVGLVAAIVAVGLGWSHWSLVVQQVVIGVTLLAGRSFAADWWPTLPRRHAPIRPFLRYGGTLVFAQALSYGASNVDTLVIGARLGAGPLGLYSRAFQLVTVPITQLLVPLTNVALPVLTRVGEDSLRYWRSVRQIQSAVGLLLIPALATAAALAEPLVAIVLGPEWRGVDSVFAVLAAGGSFQFLSFVSYWVFLSRGLTASLVRYNLITKTVAIVFIVVGSQWGVIGVATAFSLGLALSWPASLWWLSRVAGLPVRSLLVTGSLALGTGLSCYVCTSVASHLTGQWGDWCQLAAGVLAAGMAYSLVAMTVTPVFRDISMVRGLVRR